MKITKEYLNTLSKEDQKKAIIKEYIKCSNDIKYAIETYLTVLNGSKRIPFILYPHQIDAVDSYEKFVNSILMKTRQMGLTTITAAYIACKIIFNNNFKVPIISKDMKAAQDFLKEIKDMLDDAREKYPWLVPDYLPKYNNKQAFILKNGSLVKAEGGDQAGRGTPGATLCVVDECAYIDKKFPGKMDSIWAAISPTLASTKGKSIMISTPAGSNGWYYETYINSKEKGFHIIDAHWTKHPVYSLGQYQWISNLSEVGGGHFEFFGKDWPESIFDKDTGTYIKQAKEDYPFNMDGKVRSPWYDFNSNKLGPRLSKCELDCSFVGTGGEVLDSEILRKLKLFAEELPFTNPYESLKGSFRKYKQFKEYNPAHKYIIACDVATGDGNDYSTFVIFDVTTFEVVGSYKEQLMPSAFAEVLYIIGKEFGNCPLIVENQGGGFTTLQTLKEKGYPNIYYSNLQKKDPSTGMAKRKIGLWASEDVRLQGGDLLEEKIRTGQLNIPCTVMVEELFNWIWDKDGKRRHAPGKNDDLIMALQHALWYTIYVYNRGQRNKTTFKKIFEIQRTDGVKSIRETEINATFLRDSTSFNSDKRKMAGNIDKLVDPRVTSNSNYTKVKKEIPKGKRTFI